MKGQLHLPHRSVIMSGFTLANIYFWSDVQADRNPMRAKPERSFWDLAGVSGEEGARWGYGY